MALDANIRNFIWEDTEQITHLFNEINGIAGTEKEYDVGFMREFLSQPSCDPEHHCFVAESNGSLVGFVLISPELKIGRAVASGGVVESPCALDLRRRLLRTAIDHAATLGASVLHVEAPSGRSDLHQLLASEGFSIVRRHWQMRWGESLAPELRLRGEFTLRPFKLDQDEEALTELQNTSFGDNWGFAPNTVDEIRARVRLSRGAADGIIFIVDGERPIAYNWTFISSNGTSSVGFVSMTGVHPDYRGKGLGRSVVVAGMQYLKAKGVNAVELEVDYENPAARELYLKLGFQKIGETVWFEKRLD